MRIKADIMLLPDPNVAVEKVSFKNIRSYEELENCIIAEVKRQAEILKSGGKIETETRRYNRVGAMHESLPLRKNDTSVDFRYLADTDIPSIKLNPIRIAKCTEILERKLTPFEIKKELGLKHGLTVKEVAVIMANPKTLSTFEELVAEGKNSKTVYTWMYVHLAKIASDDDLSLQLAV